MPAAAAKIAGAPMRRTAILLIFLVSGAAGLIYQVVWTRLLTLMLGVTFAAVSTVLAVFMAGLALGSAWLGRRADRSPSPLRLYGALELGIAAAGALSPLALHALTGLYADWHQAGALPPAALPGLRLALVAALLLVPTTLMGGTLPVLIRGVCRSPERIAREAGLLYGINTLGALAGTLLAAFVLIRSLGLTASIGVAAGLNLLSGLAAFALARGEPRRAAAGSTGPLGPEPAARSGPADATDPTDPTDPTDATGPIDATDPIDPKTARAVVLAFAVSGFAALGYEVLWTRYLVYVVGENSVYAFSLILASFLAGIVLGSLLAAAFADRLDDLVGALGALIGFAGAAALATVTLMAQVGGALQLPADAGFWTVSAARLGRCLLVTGVPTTLCGCAFAIVARVVARDPARLGAAAGRAYAWNTAGGIAGSLCAGFWILPRLGLARGLLLLGALHVATGLWLLLRGRRDARSGVLAGLVAVAALGSLLAVDWRRPWFGDLGSRSLELLYFADGPEATVAIVRDLHSDERSLVFDGDVQATTDPLQQVHLRLLGHLPALFHPAPRDALVVGFGAGFSTGALAAHPELRVDVAELTPAVIRGAEHFAPYNGDPLADPDVRVIHQDGRNHLLTTRRRYDVITSDPVDPDDAGVTNLYSAEYFELVKSRLRPGGVASQWLATRYDLASFQLIVRTFQSVFPYASLWRTGHSTVMLGSREPPRMELPGLRRRLATPGVRESLAAIGIDSAEALLSLYLAGPEAVRGFAGEGPRNTDDRPRVEYRLPRTLASARRWLAAEVGARLFALREPNLSGWLAAWSARDRAALQPTFAGMSQVLERNMVLRPRLEEAAARAEGAPPAAPAARARAALAARYWERSVELYARPLSGIERIEAGLGPEGALTGPAARDFAVGLLAFEAAAWAEAERAFLASGTAAPRALRPFVLAAACAERRGRPRLALRLLARADASRRAGGTLRELEWLAEGLARRLAAAG